MAKYGARLVVAIDLKEEDMGTEISLSQPLAP